MNKEFNGIEELEGLRVVHMGAGARDGLLQEKRLNLEMTQQQVADAAKIGLSTYQKFESGERNIRTASFDITCRVLRALGMDPTDFFDGKYVFGEPTFFDSEGQKYVKTGRLVSEDIDDDEAINVMRVHIVDRSLIIPLKILRAMGSPSFIKLLFNMDEKKMGIQALNNADDDTVTVLKEAYSGKWRGIRVDNAKLMKVIYDLLGRDTGRYLSEPEFFEKGCIVPLGDAVKSDYKLKADNYLQLVIEKL